MTSVTTATPAELREALAQFVPGANSYTFARCTGGVNNAVYVASSPGKDDLIVRIYRNGKNAARVIFEHAVLDKLSKMTSLSFATPKMLPSLFKPTTHVTLTSGDEACVCKVIEGQGPPLDAARVIGRATAELVNAMHSMTFPRLVVVHFFNFQRIAALHHGTFH